MLTKRIAFAAAVLALCAALVIGLASGAVAEPPRWETDLGSVLTDLTGEDDEAQEITLSFPLPYAGSNYSTIYVGTNGAIALGGWGEADDYPSGDEFQDTTDPMIAPFWSDMDLQDIGLVKFNDFGDRAVITWDSVGSYEAGHLPFTFQTQLVATGEIVFGYHGIPGIAARQIDEDVHVGLTEGNLPAFPLEIDYSNAPFPSGHTVVEVFEINSVFDLDYSNVVFTPQPGGYSVTREEGTPPPPPPPPGPPPGPPPAPLNYQMGTVVNGDFEAAGGSLNGWGTYAEENSTVTVETLKNDHTDHAAKLHSEGEPWFGPGHAGISQPIYVPLDATELTFLYCTRLAGVWEGDFFADVRLGDASAEIGVSVDWTTFVLPVDQADKGRRVAFSLEAYDVGWDEASWQKSLDLYVDYIGIDGTPPPPPPPPPVPPDYRMGTVANGDFEAAGGSLDGWGTSAEENSTVTVETLKNDHTDHAAKLHSQGDWWYQEPDPMMPPEEQGWHYDSGLARISQTIYVPLDATELSFLYCTQSGGELEGDPYGYVRLGDGSAWFDECVDWATFVLSVEEADKGKRVTLSLTAFDSGWGEEWGGDPWGDPPWQTRWLDLYLDYVGIDGTVPTIQTTAWAAGAEGGPWGLAGNWDPGDVPHNTLSKIHDVLIPESAGDPGVITVSTPRTIQTLADERTQGTLEVQPGGHLEVIEDASFAGATVRILPGGQVSALSNMFLNEGTLTIHPGGSAAGGQALTVQETLKLGTASWEGGTSAHMSLCDATVNARILTLRSESTVALTKSPAFEEPTSLVATYDINVYDSTTLTIGPDTEVVTPDLYVSSGATLNVQDGGAIRDLSPGRAYMHGTANFTGDCLLHLDEVRTWGTMNVSTGTTHLTGDLRAYGGTELILTGATLQVDEDLSLCDGCTVTADDQSTIALGADLFNSMEDGSAFHLDEARVLFDGGGASAMDVAGVNRGPFTSGLTDNFAVGALEVGGPTNLQLEQVAGGGALYVYDVILGPGSSLNLGGVPLYYANQFINNGGSYSGGEPQRLYARPPGLPPVAPADYTATAEALWSTTTVNNGPAEAHEEQWGAGPGWPATADAFADLTQTGDATVLKMTISGESGMEEWWEEPWEEPWEPGWQEPIPTDASAEVTGTVRVGENGDYPAGTPLELLILVNQRTTWTGDDFQWSCQVEHGSDVVVFDAANTDPVTWAVLAGDELAVSAWMSDESWSGGFDHSLEVSFITMPEPATLAIVGLGLAGCLALRRRK